MKSPLSVAILASMVLCSLPSEGQTHHPHRSHNPNSAANDPQLLLPGDQAQFCPVTEGSRSAYEQFQQYDTYAQPASKGYLCVTIPAGKTYVIDHLFAEADYDQALPAEAEWYLDTVVGDSEVMTGFAASHVGSATASPHYLLSQPVRIPVAGGTRVTLIMHNYFVSANSSIVETPGTANLVLIGHWEQ
jgi:hypothetical protein